MAVVSLGAAKAVATALRRRAAVLECAELLLTLARDLSEPLPSVPHFVAEGTIRSVVAVLQNARASAELRASCCCFLANMAREEVGTRAVLAAGAHKTALASLRRLGSTNVDLVSTVCGIFASMCIYPDGAKSFFAPGVSTLLATNVLKCTRELNVVHQGCRLLLNAATKCSDGSKLFDGHWRRFLTIARVEHAADAEVTMRLCSVLANASALDADNVTMAMEMRVPRIAAEALSRYLSVADTAAAAYCMIGNICSFADDLAILQQLLDADTVEGVYAAAASYSDSLPVARRICAALAGVVGLEQAPVFHHRLASVILSRFATDEELVQGACAAFSTLLDHAGIGRWLLRNGGFAAATAMLRANLGNAGMALKALGCVSGVLTASQFELPPSLERILAGVTTTSAKLPLPTTAQELFDFGAAEALITLLRSVATARPKSVFTVAGVLNDILELLEARH